MNAKTLTSSDLRTIALALDVDVDVRGGISAFARIIGKAPSQVARVMQTGTMSRAVATAAIDAAKALENGTLSALPNTLAPTVDLDALKAAADPDFGKTDEQVLTRVNKRFAFMMRYVDGAVKSRLGRFNCVLVTGPGGIGKTHPIEMYLNDYKAQNPGKNVVMVSGDISAVKLVEVLHECSNKGDVVVLDDADKGFKDQSFMNVFKAATDPKTSRTISWLKQNAKLAEAGVPESFEFKGAVIVISNMDMKAMAEKGSNAGHVDAVLSRSRHIDLGINSSRALALRVKYMIEEVDMFGQDFAAAGMSDLHDQAKVEISTWICDHKDDFRSLTLREACKIASCYIMCEGDSEWSEMAEMELGSF